VTDTIALAFITISPTGSTNNNPTYYHRFPDFASQQGVARFQGREGASPFATGKRAWRSGFSSQVIYM
jgi:hypothetical protein